MQQPFRRPAIAFNSGMKIKAESTDCGIEGTIKKTKFQAGFKCNISV